MTSQMCDFVLYEGKEYCLMGYTGGDLPTASDFQMQFLPGSTADARGHCMWYGFEDNHLVVKRVEIRGEEIEPITHQYRLIENDGSAYYDLGNPIINMTGHVLFSEVWQVDSLYLSTLAAGQDWKYTLFEAEVESGKVVSVNEISEWVCKITLDPKTEKLGVLWNGNTKQEWLASIERIWDITSQILPRRYDTLYKGIWYINFREKIAELRTEIP